MAAKVTPTDTDEPPTAPAPARERVQSVPIPDGATAFLGPFSISSLFIHPAISLVNELDRAYVTLRVKLKKRRTHTAAVADVHPQVPPRATTTMSTYGVHTFFWRFMRINFPAPAPDLSKPKC